MKLEETSCPLCGTAGGEFFHEEAGFRYVSCTSCGLVYMNPRPAAGELLGHYQTYLPVAGEEIEAWRISMTPLFAKSARMIEEMVRGPGRILDVGCGFGFFPRLMADRGWEAVGLEISGFGADFAEGRLGVTVARATLKEAGFAPGSFDAVTAFYVIEHLPDPLAACLEAARILKPGGVLLLRWPHSAPLVKWTSRFNLNLGLMHAPSHLCQFSPRSVAALLERSGFVRVRTVVGGWTWPANPLWRLAGVGGGILAEALGRISGGRLLLPGVSKTTTAVKP